MSSLPANTAADNSSPAVDQSKLPALSVKRVLGKHEAESLGGNLLVENLERLEKINPQLGRSLIESGFGSNSNSSLGRREGAMIIIAALIAMGDLSDQLKVYTGAALKHGATEQELLDLTTQIAAFVGAPRAVNALRSISGLLQSTSPFLCTEVVEKLICLDDHETLVRQTPRKGTPIILIHALSMDSRMWREILPGLAKDAWVVAYDLRGHGSARAAPLTKSLEHLAYDLLLLMDDMNIDKADVYGASYGGGVAMHFALAYPTRVRSLALIATVAKTHPLLATRAEAAEKYGMEAVVPESIIRWFLPETIARDDWMVRYARSCVRKARVKDWAAAWRAMAALDCIERFEEINVPILCLCGKQDASTPPELMKPTFEACKRGEYRELNPGTHMMVMEQAEAAAAELAAFRKRIDEAHKTA